MGSGCCQDSIPGELRAMNAHRPIDTTRRWFRFAFSLRTLFLAVTVSCCFLGYQLHWIHQRHEVLRSRQVREYFARTASGRARVSVAAAMVRRTGVHRFDRASRDRVRRSVSAERSFPRIIYLPGPSGATGRSSTRAQKGAGAAAAGAAPGTTAQRLISPLSGRLIAPVFPAILKACRASHASAPWPLAVRGPAPSGGSPRSPLPSLPSTRENRL